MVGNQDPWSVAGAVAAMQSVAVEIARRPQRLIADGFFDEPRAGNAAFEELKRRGFQTAKPNVYREADKLAEQGFLTREAAGYQKAPGARVRVREQ